MNALGALKSIILKIPYHKKVAASVVLIARVTMLLRMEMLEVYARTVKRHSHNKSNKNIETWKKFCECMNNKFSLRKSDEICEIILHTAFNWKHKILDALQNMQDDVTLKGVLETDESFFRLSIIGT